jgi:hypothetical protein
MDRNRWIVMLLLVSLLVQTTAVAAPNPCDLAGRAMGPHTAMHGEPDCCDGAVDAACPPGECAMGGCVSVFLFVFQPASGVPIHWVPSFFYPISHQAVPLFPLFRPPIA